MGFILKCRHSTEIQILAALSSSVFIAVLFTKRFIMQYIEDFLIEMVTKEAAISFVSLGIISEYHDPTILHLRCAFVFSMRLL